ncbi:hypothetical protein BC834DRAFT_1032317 [Gloeopeniophorella convolvens]|nr:hypothetical protein BC834DRAFT_1032317 [Gloeopeniophorella convolvens]
MPSRKLIAAAAPAPTLSGFTWSTIGQSPSLLDRMSDTPRMAFRQPSPEPLPAQDQPSPPPPSQARSRPPLSQSTVASSAPQTETSKVIKAHVAHQSQSYVPAIAAPSTPPSAAAPRAVPSTIPSTAPSAVPSAAASPPDALFPPIDHARMSAIPDLQYPQAPSEVDNPLSPSLAQSQHVPMEIDPPRPSRVAQHVRTGDPGGVPVDATDVADGLIGAVSPVNGQSSTPSLTTRSTTSSEPEAGRRPVEHFLKMASMREDRIAKHREIYEHRTGELSTFSADAVQSTDAVHDQIQALKTLAEEARAQAEHLIEEGNKTRDFADRMIASADALCANVQTMKGHVSRSTERSEQMTRFEKKLFDWLSNLRAREEPVIEQIQAELAEQARVELAAKEEARLKELQQQLERRKLEERKAKEEAARRAQEEQEATKKAEVEAAAEAERQKIYAEQRAQVLATKRRATERQAQSIQAEREKKAASRSHSSSVSHSISPGAVEQNSVAKTPTPAPPSQPTAAPISRSSSSRNENAPSTPKPAAVSTTSKAKLPPTGFVPAQTEAGRAVNTDSPLSSTILASELQAQHQQAHFQGALSPLGPADAFQRSQLEPLQTDYPMSEVKREPIAEEVPLSPIHPLPLKPSPEAIGIGNRRHEPPPRSSSPGRTRSVRPSASSNSRPRGSSTNATRIDGQYRRDLAPSSYDQSSSRYTSTSHEPRGRPPRLEHELARVVQATKVPVFRFAFATRSRSRSPLPEYPHKRKRSITPEWQRRYDSPRDRPRLRYDDYEMEERIRRQRFRDRDYDVDFSTRRRSSFLARERDRDRHRDREGGSPEAWRRLSARRYSRESPPATPAVRQEARRLETDTYRPTYSAYSTRDDRIDDARTRTTTSVRASYSDRAQDAAGTRRAAEDSRPPPARASSPRQAPALQWASSPPAVPQARPPPRAATPPPTRAPPQRAPSPPPAPRTFPSAFPPPLAAAEHALPLQAPAPVPAAPELGLLDRIDMQAVERGQQTRGRGAAGGSTGRGGTRGRGGRGAAAASTSTRGGAAAAASTRGGAAAATPALLSRMSGDVGGAGSRRGGAPLSERIQMQQD